MKLIKNYLYNMSYQIIAIILPLLTVPYISRTLGPESVGINSYTNAIITYFILLANVGITVYGGRTISYSRDNWEERSKNFWEIVAIKFMMGTISYSFLLIFVNIYHQYSTFLLFQSIQIVAAALDISWFFTGLEEFKKTVTRNILVKILSAVLIFMFVKTSDDLILYITIISGSTLFGNLTLWTYLKKFLLPVNFKSLTIKNHFLPISVLFIPQLATQLFMTLNKLLLGNLSSISQTGYFDNSDKIIRILLTAVTSVGVVVFPRIANSFKNNNNADVLKFMKLSFDMVSLISIPFVLGLILISKDFSRIYFGSSFDGIEITLAILSIELIFMGWSTVFGNQFLVAIDQTKGLTISVIVGTCFLLLSSSVLIPKYGATGAAISSVIGEFVIASVQIMFVKKHIDILFVVGDFLKFLISGLLMFVICLPLGNIFENNILSILFQVVVGMFVYGLSIFVLKPQISKLNELKSILND